MDASLTGMDIALRLACSFAAGALLGYNRGEHGHTAGLRTTILVSLAAAAAMLTAFALLPAQAHGVASFARMDVMRLPLGILSGIGFIGAGAIVRQGDIVRGVTTAATIWITTVIGLVFGAGLLAFGAGLTLVTFVVVWAIKQIEPRLMREHRASLAVTVDEKGPADEAIRARLEHDAFKILAWSVSYRDSGTQRDIHCEVKWMSRVDQSHPPLFVAEIGTLPGVILTSWRPRGAGEVS